MESTTKPVKIGVFGHYGNQNLGDEAIIEAVIRNLRYYVPGCEIVCLSINPMDSRERHQVEAFPIRYRKDYFHPSTHTSSPSSVNVKNTEKTDPVITKGGIKNILKSIPVLGRALKATARLAGVVSILRQEIRFLQASKRYLRDIDLLLVTGSNQFLDNFGGPLGFPYTLCKWTLLAKNVGAKVAFISIGAGPLTQRTSYWLLKIALKRADYLSYRDDGSKELIESRIEVDAPVYPDIAHSLGAVPSTLRSNNQSVRVAVNPMPVYDSRYWHHPDDEKYNDYVDKMVRLCIEILADGHQLDLFSTQSKDENVIDDILAELQSNVHFEQWSSQIVISKSKEVSELMKVLDRADITVATRFHATVLPFQLGKPVLGICYYRKAAELLDDVGLGAFKVNIDDFDAQTLIKKYRTLIMQWQQDALDIERPFKQYIRQLDQQYNTIAGLVSNPERISKNAQNIA